MSKLVQIARDLVRGFKKYELAYDELDAVERAFNYRQDANDIVDYEGGKLVDAIFRYSGMITQGYIAGSAMGGYLPPSEAFDAIIFIEGMKGFAHLITETKISRKLFRLKSLKVQADNYTI